jgi:hypothetical protein
MSSSFMALGSSLELFECFGKKKKSLGKEC